MTLKLKFLLLVMVFVMVAGEGWAQPHTIASISPPVKWQIISTRGVYQNTDISFEQIDKTHTKVIIMPIGDKVTLLTDLSKEEADIKNIPITKTLQTSKFSIDKSNLDFQKAEEISFTITHPEKLEVGWQIEIGTHSATIGTSTNTAPFDKGQTDYIHYANGYYWVIFYDGTEPSIYSSSDGNSWTDRGAILDSEPTNTQHYAVCWNGNYTYCVGSDYVANRWYYQRITLNADGTATFGALDEQVYPASTYYARERYCGSGIRNGGNPAIFTDQSFNDYLHTFNDNDDTADAEDNVDFIGTHNLVPATKAFEGTDSGDLTYFAYKAHGNQNYGFLIKDMWDDSAGGLAGPTIIANQDMFDEDAGEGLGREQFGVCKDTSGNYQIVYISIAGELTHKQLTSGDSLSTINGDITGLTTHRKMCLGIADNDDLYLFYDKQDGTNDNKIYYRTCATGGDNWGSENILKSDTAALLGAIVCSDELNDNVLCAWAEGASSPYDVKIELISVGAPPAGTIRQGIISTGVGAGIGKGER